MVGISRASIRLSKVGWGFIKSNIGEGIEWPGNRVEHNLIIYCTILNNWKHSYSGFSFKFFLDFVIVIVDFPFLVYSGFSFIVDFHDTRFLNELGNFKHKFFYISKCKFFFTFYSNRPKTRKLGTPLPWLRPELMYERRQEMKLWIANDKALCWLFVHIVLHEPYQMQ